MYLKNKIIIQKNIPWYRPITSIVYALSVAIIYQYTDLIKPIPLTILSIIGTAISLFLGFRTNSAYQRWWEARKVWGEIVNNSRTFTRQLLNFGNIDKAVELRKSIIFRQIYWCWNLAHSLRNIEMENSFNKYLSEDEREKLKDSTNIPNKLLLHHQNDLTKLVKENSIDEFDYRKIDTTLQLLCNSMGKCERIKKTTFPVQYSFYVRIFIYIFLFLLPFGLVDSLNYYTIIVQLLVGFTFIITEYTASILQDPFENKPSDTAMFSISRTIEQNLLEMIGEKEIPASWKANHNILM